MHLMVLNLALTVWMGAGEITIPAGTEAKVRLLENVSSCCNLTNALVMIAVEEEVRVNGRVVFPKDSRGIALVRFSSTSRDKEQARERLGTKVELAPQVLTAVDGTKVKLHPTTLILEEDADYVAGERGDVRQTGDQGYWVRGSLRARSGTRYTVRTLKTTAVDPGRSVKEPERDLTEPTLQAKIKPESLVTSLVEPNEPVKFVLRDASPELLELYRVNDLFLPKPVFLSLERKTRKKAFYEIFRWTLIRYGREDKNTLYLRFRRHDGSLNYVKATYSLFFDWDNNKPVENNRKHRRRRLNPTIPGQN